MYQMYIICIYINVFILESIKTDWLGTSGPREGKSNEFPGFSFCLMDPVAGDEDREHPPPAIP